ncbi:MAG: DUF3046 domain-containing protein [Corynebacterium sp.]|nr:DUF3046 domain-containing protein [Corynebacterium sp.]
MRQTHFYALVNHEFGEERGDFILHHHLISGRNKTASELEREGVDLRDVWAGLCADFDVPPDRQFGPSDLV